MDIRHQTTHGNKGGTVDWLTPPHIINSLGKFDLDPCTPDIMPWVTAERRYTKEDDGLSKEWEGRVWMNPPYDKEVLNKWLKKLSEHGNGITLIFNRTETNYFFESIWNKADAVLFIKGRIHFYKVDGTKGGPAGCGSVLIAYGEENVIALENSNIDGKLIRLKK